MNVSAWSIRNPVPGVLLFIMLTLVGLLAFNAMKIQNFPDIDLPTVTVTASLPGASPAQLETEVARKIENSIATLQGVKHIYTTVQDGTAIVTTEFRLEKPTQEAVDDVRAAVSRVRSDLPGDLRDPVVTKMELSGAPILTYTIASSRMDDEALSWFVDNTVGKTLLSVRGVGAVSRVGGVTREVRVELDPARLQGLNATAADISRQLRQVQQEASGGRTDVGGAEQSVRTIATVKSADELSRMEITLTDGRRIRLDQVANVSDTVAEQRSAALLNGKPVVGFEITRTRGAGETEVAAGVRKQLDELKAANPEITITEAFNFVDPVQENYDGSMVLLYEGAALAVLVVFLFLRDWRATLVSATALPLSIIPAFGVMYLFGFTLNGVTLLSLSLVVGILVDDAIVEIENIMRHLRMGKSPFAAAMEAADEIGLAVIATTFTLIAVFLPTAFMSGIPGKFFVQFGWTAAIAVFMSLVVARMLTPMMAAYVLKVPKKEHREGAWVGIYMRWVKGALNHRVWTTIAATVFLVGSFMLVPLLPTGFIPPDDLSQTQVSISLPPGATFAQTFATAEAARAIVEKNENVKLIYTAIGGGNTGSDPFAPGGAAEVTKATLTINMTPRAERHGLKKQVVEQQLRDALETLPGARVKVGFGGSNEKYVLVLAGEDGDQLSAHARLVERDLRTIPGIGNGHVHVQPGAARADRAARFRTRCRSGRHLRSDRRHAAHRHRGRLRSIAAQAQPQPASGAHRRQAQGRCAHRPRPALTPGRARRTRAGDAGQRRHARHRQRPGADRPLRPPTQHQFRARAQRPAAGRSRTVGEAGAVRELAEPEGDASIGITQRRASCWRRRGNGRTLRELRSSCDATGVACIYIVLVLLFHDFVQPVMSILGALLLVDRRRLPRAPRHARGGAGRCHR